MRFSKRDLFRKSNMLKKIELRKILMTNLGLTSNDVDIFFNRKESLPHYRVIKGCQLYQKYNINVEPVEKLHYCFKLHSCTLEHRINVLKDIGVPAINTSLLSNLARAFYTELSKFKKETNIPAEQNIAMNIFGGKVPKDISQLKLSDNLTVQQYYQTCLLYCKTRIFNLPYLDDKILLRHFIRVKSISMIAETLKVLRMDLHYDEKMIKKNPLVIIASADNIRLLLSNFTDILGIPIVTCLQKYPFILLQDANNIKQLLMLFKQYEIPDKYVKKCMKIFLLSNEAFCQRIEMIKRHPHLNLWYQHPRMLQIMYFIGKTKDRLGYVDIMNSWKWSHPHLYLSTKTELDKSMQNGMILSKPSLKHVFMKELGVDESDLLIRHQHWKISASFVDIVQMLKYLKNHFTINEIRPNIHIVLYEQSRVEKVLAYLKQHYSKNTEYSFTNSQYLALCLYMLEKDNHFTGDGVWNKEQNIKQQSLKEGNIIESFDDNNTMKNINYNNLNIDNLKDSNSIDHKEIINVKCNTR